MTEYANPDALVTTAWVDAHRKDSDIRLVEVNVDHDLYASGHVPEAISWSWKTQLADARRRDILSPHAFASLMETSGISPSTTVILYGDFNNWFAAWAFWQMKVYRHPDVRIMDGGRAKWLAEERETSVSPTTVPLAEYPVPDADVSLRARLGEVWVSTGLGAADLVDVRSPEEFSGEILAPEGLPETCQRGGHIPGASSIPWSKAVRGDGTFKTRAELVRIYADAGITGNKPVITYCRIGERSSHSWFVLRYLLGFNAVRNYDGSWTEWGNLVGAPIETGAPARELAATSTDRADP